MKTRRERRSARARFAARCGWLVLAALIWPRGAEAVIVVNNQGGGDATTIQAGIDLAIAMSDPLVEIIGSTDYTGAGNTGLDFHGVSLTVRSTTDPAAVIDCQGAARGFSLVSGESTGARIEGLVIRDALVGVHCDNGSAPSIVDCTIEGCDTGIAGDYGFSSDPIAVHTCILTGNTVGLSIVQADIQQCAFVANSTGLVTYESSAAVIQSSSFRQNVTGVSANPGSPDFLECEFVDNAGSGIAGAAGIVASHCRIAGNGGWGVSLATSASSSLSDCFVVGNDDGGIQVLNLASVTVTRCTIMDNAGAGGVVVDGGLAGVDQSILWDNCPIQGTQTGGGPSSIAVTCSVVPTGGVTGVEILLADNVDSDPLVCSPVACSQAPSSAGDYGLLTGSPCFPANNPCGVQIGATLDGCSPSSAPDWVGPGRGAIRATPNPFARRVQLALRVERSGFLNVEVVDVTGRHVADLYCGDVDGFSGICSWSPDGAAGPGVYFIRAIVDGAAVSSSKVIRVP